MSEAKCWLLPIDPLYRSLELWAAIERMELRRAWCVAAAKPGRERQVQAELAMLGWETYLPMQTVWVGKGGARNRRRSTTPLFARYLFVACPEGVDPTSHHDVQDLTALHRLESGRSAVRIDLLARLMLAEAAHAFDLTYVKPRVAKTGWVCGQSVTVRAGAMSGIEGLIIKVLSEREVRVRLPVIVLGKDEAVFESADLEASWAA